MTTQRQDEWRVDVGWWAASAVLTGVAFGIGQGLTAGLLIGGAMVALVVVLHLGRRRIDAVRVVGGAGDERNQLLSTRATAVTSGVVVMVMTGWFLVSAALGEPNETLMILLPLYLVVQVVSSAYLARRG